MACPPPPIQERWGPRHGQARQVMHPLRVTRSHFASMRLSGSLALIAGGRGWRCIWRSCASPDGWGLNATNCAACTACATRRPSRVQSMLCPLRLFGLFCCSSMSIFEPAGQVAVICAARVRGGGGGGEGTRWIRGSACDYGGVRGDHKQRVFAALTICDQDALR